MKKLFLFGLLSSLAFAPTDLVFVLFFTFPFLLENVVKSTDKKDVIKKAFVFGFGYFVGGLYWICSSLLIEPLVYGWLIPFALILIPGFLSLYIILTCLCTFYASKKIKNKFIVSLIFAICWIFFECLRGKLIIAFPWNIIATTTTFSSYFMFPVRYFGTEIYGIVLILLYCFKFYFIENKKISYSFLCCFLTFILYGVFMINTTKISYLPYNIRLVQPSIPQNLKWDANLLKKNFDELISLSKSEDTKNIDYFVWAESSIPYIINMKNIDNNEIFNYINDNLLHNEKRLISGFIRVNGDKYYNSFGVIEGNQLLNYYDKYFLVPFGEYIPLKKYIPFAKKITEGTVDFSKGRKQDTIFDGKLPLFSPNICYESIFKDSINMQAKLIVSITNDSWFGNTSGPYQHFSNLKLRAVENGIPVIRVGNSGISAVIDGFGRVNKKIKLNKKAILDIKIPLI